MLGLAQILGMAETNTRINDRPVVKLSLRISGPGLATFDAEDRVIADMTRLGVLTAGRLAVLVDPATGRFRIDWERSSLVTGQMPATCAIAEGDATYDLTGQVEPLMGRVHGEEATDHRRPVNEAATSISHSGYRGPDNVRRICLGPGRIR